MKDWYQPRDKGPIEQEYRCLPYKKPKKKKEFIIERRYVGPPREFMRMVYENQREWHNHRKYSDAIAREQAFTTITRRQTNSYRYYRLWEYRIKQ